MAFPSLKDFSRWVSSTGIFFPGEGRKEEEGAERGHDCRSHFSAPGKPIEPPGAPHQGHPAPAALLGGHQRHKCSCPASGGTKLMGLREAHQAARWPRRLMAPATSRAQWPSSGCGGRELKGDGHK